MRITVTLLMLLSSILSFSQEKYDGLEVELASIDLEQSKTMKLLNIYNYNDHLFILKKEPVRGPGGWEYYIEEFDENHKSIKSTKINNLLKSLDNLKIINFLQIDNHFVLIYNIEEKENLKIVTYSQKYNIETGDFSSPEIIHEFNYVRQQIHKIYYSFKISPNKKSFASSIITYVSIMQSNPDQKSFDFSFYFFYNGKTQTYSKKQVPRFVMEYNVDDEGNLLLTIGIRKFNDNLKVSGSKIVLQVIKEDDEESFVLDLDEDVIYANVLQNKNGTHYLAGSFQNEKGLGSFYSHIDITNGNISQLNECLFSDDFIQLVESKAKRLRTKKEKKSGRFESINNLRIKDLITSENNSTILLFEISKDFFSVNKENQSIKHYNIYEGYIVNYFNENNETTYKYHKKYSKNFQNSIYLSHNNEISIISIQRKVDMVNKPIDELTKAERKQLGGYVLGITTINKDSDVIKEILIDYTSEEYTLFIRPKELVNTTFTRSDANEFYMLTSIKGNKFGILLFKL